MDISPLPMVIHMDPILLLMVIPMETSPLPMEIHMDPIFLLMATPMDISLPNMVIMHMMSFQELLVN